MTVTYMEYAHTAAAIGANFRLLSIWKGSLIKVTILHIYSLLSKDFVVALLIKVFWLKSQKLKEFFFVFF